jgi:CRISPR-associated protein Cmr6
MALERDHYRSASNPHTGLVLDRCLQDWPSDETKKGEAFVKFIREACELPVAPVYSAAYARWHETVLEAAHCNQAALWCGQVEGRLFIGMGGVSPLEAAITLHHTYGTPILPGSALKGLTRAYAFEQVEGGKRRVDRNTFDVLFGREPASDCDHWDGGDAGYLIFNDAWWIPGSIASPLASEIITVHHADYYTSQGKNPATDFDSPTPNAQIAVQGSFLFSVEGVGEWAGFGMELLKAALQQWGVGAKTSAGYGYFVEDGPSLRALNKSLATRKQQDMPVEEQLRATLAGWSEKQLAEYLGKDWKKTMETLSSQYPGLEEACILLLDEVWGDVLKTWENSDSKNCQKAYKKWKNALDDL